MPSQDRPTTLVVVFSDGYINIGRITIVGSGSVSSTDWIFSRDRDKIFKANNGFIYPYHSIVKAADMNDEEIKAITRDKNIEGIFN